MQRDRLLVDIGALSCACTGHALEALAKAMSGEDETGPDIWAKHESLFIQSLIELFSSRGLLRLQKVQAELAAWLAGKYHKPGAVLSLPRPAAPAGGWLPDELALVKIYLENLPPAAFHLSDWSLVIDYLVRRYLPPEQLAAEAQWLAVRSTIMGKVQASMMGMATLQQTDTVLAALPLTVAQATETFHFSDAIKHILEFGWLRCADNVVQLTESVRHRLKRVIMTHQEQILTGARPPAHSLQTQLFDEFGAMNRDWRRIAVTEAGENANQGMIASMSAGARVQRMEQYRGACPYCKKINGTIMTVVDAAKPDKNGITEIWIGKNNIGRSGAPRKRTADGLVDRLPSELWWVPAGTVHPHCRGLWHPLPDAQPGDDPEFAAWLAATLKKPGLV